MELGAERHQNHYRIAGIAVGVHHTGWYGEAPYLPRRYFDIPNDLSLLEAHQAGAHDAGGLHRREMNVVAAHFVGLSQHHMHVLLSGEFNVGKRLEYGAARVAG